MSNLKSKVFVIALAVCLIAVASLGTLAWFNDSDEVKNDFFISNSEDDPDDIFSVDVWEDDTENDPLPGDPEEPKLDGIEFDDILPGDELYKEVHIENTGAYDQYIRATVTVSDASVWQKVYGQRLVPLTAFVETIDEAALYTTVSYYDAVNDAFVYELYYKDVLAPDAEFIVFDRVNISTALDRFQAAELAGSFYINVVADAVQTENVGSNVYEAFKTVGLVNDLPVTNAADLAAALQSDTVDRVVLDATADWSAPLVIDYAVSNKTIDFNGANGTIEFAATASASNVVVTGIVDTDGTTNSVKTVSGFTGDLSIVGCSFVDANGTPNGAVSVPYGNITIDDCSFTGIAKSYGVYSTSAESLTITNCTFNNFGSWAIQINGRVAGDLTVDNCVFDTPDGVLKALSGVGGDFTFTNNTMIGCKGHDGKAEALVVSTSKNLPVTADGTITYAGNTLDGVAWAQ